MALIELFTIVIVWFVAATRLPYFGGHFDHESDWLDFFMFTCLAIFVTGVLPAGYNLITRVVSPGTVYSTSSLALVGIGLGMLRYLAVYDSAPHVTQHSAVTIPGLALVKRMLFAAGILLVPLILGIELVWTHAWISHHGLQPLSVRVGHGTLVVSRVALCSYLIALLWLGHNYPLLYLIRHQSSTEPAVQIYGGVVRFSIIIVYHALASFQIFMNMLATMVLFFSPNQTVLEQAALLSVVALTPINIILVGVRCLPKHIWASFQSYLFCFQLLPLHDYLRSLTPQVFLNIPLPTERDIILDSDTVIITLQRILAEITDARLTVYGPEGHQAGSPASVPEQVSVPLDGRPTSFPLLEPMAFYEAQLLVGVREGRSLPASLIPSELSTKPYQSLQYYRHLSQALEQLLAASVPHHAHLPGQARRGS